VQIEAAKIVDNAASKPRMNTPRIPQARAQKPHMNVIAIAARRGFEAIAAVR
jgi:hypothetical protein